MPEDSTSGKFAPLRRDSREEGGKEDGDGCGCSLWWVLGDDDRDVDEAVSEEEAEAVLPRSAANFSASRSRCLSTNFKVPVTTS